MDTGYDFLQPEFLNIIFFQQKSLVIFPYVDIKHLKALEVFAEGYNIVDIDATAIHNVSSIISHEKSHSYSLKPTLYFILNANLPIIVDLIHLPEEHYIINTSENPESLVEGDETIFYNKKSKQFLNYDPESQKLSFESSLIQESKDEHILIQKLRDIHSTATQLHSTLNENFSGTKLPSILEKFNPSTWEKILLLTSRYFNIELPKITIPSHMEMNPKNHTILKDFSDEYQLILKHNRKIGQEFIQALHNYRERKVNPAHLELEQLFYPEKLYTYLRNHHWHEGIPQEFVDDWVLMKNTGHSITENDLLDFQILSQELGFKFQKIQKPPNKVIIPKESLSSEKENKIQDVNQIECSVGSTELANDHPLIPSADNFFEFKRWIIHKITELEKKFN